MKKTYAKPDIIFESFSLCTNIAGDCWVKADTNTNFHSCGIFFESEGILFSGTWGGCEVKPVGGDDGWFNGYCYDVPAENWNVFNS